MNVLLIAHCNFRGNSAMQVFSIACELQKLGHEPCIAVPDSPETVYETGVPTFGVLDYDQARARGVRFPDGRGPDVVHAWTPREHVRTIATKLVERYGCRYVVHMEDNEEQILADELAHLGYDDLRTLPDALVDALAGPYRSHPQRFRAFIAAADGYSCLIDKLLEFKPEHVPGVVFWAGFDQPFADLTKKDKHERTRFGLSEDDVVVLYSGNVHTSIARDIKRLYVAIGLLRRRGHPVKLLRAGWTFADIGLDERHGLAEYVVDIGFVPHEQVPALVGASDILLQPGRSDRFNDYRFPSKLPEYLVSGRPVILPDSNIGKVLEDGRHVLKLYDGTIEEMARHTEALIASKKLRKRLAHAARDFALEHLTWRRAAETLDGLYREIAKRPRAALAVPPATPPLEPERAPAAAFPVRLIAFYLPQFHPIPENDAWWGRGFTEWTKTVRAKPNFEGHLQPRLPTELGFYDLRVPSVMHAQARLARAHGIAGFCFYYYWFNGRRLLERPLENWLAEGPDFPFSICWANESWSRRWDGSQDELLIRQEHDADSDARFIVDVLPVLGDPRYIRVGGAPLLLVYRADLLEDPVGAAQTWRRIAREHGLELHLCAVQSFGLGDPRPYGFDAAVEFSPPHTERQLVDPRNVRGVHPGFEGYLEDYVSVAMRAINHPPLDYVRYRGIAPQWDNTARRGPKAHVLINESPKAYAQWLRYLVREALVRREQQEPLVFVNAWNEWAESAYLEPDELYGRGLLEITREALCEGIVDYERGPTPERERAFTERVALLPNL
jgi:glycosyltransferase involved in cell wall biosynthesis